MKNINVIICLIVITISSRVYSQTESERQQAQEFYNVGVNLYNIGDYEGALQNFQNAYELTHNWRLLFNIGQTQRRLNQWSNSCETLEQYLREGGGEITEERRDEVLRIISEIREATGILRINVNIKGARVIIDGVEKGITPIEPLILQRGRHIIEVIKEGYNRFENNIEIAGGEQELNVELTEEIIEERVERQEQSSQNVMVQSTQEEIPFYRRWWFWVIVGVVASGITVGTVLGVTKPIEEEPSFDQEF